MYCMGKKAKLGEKLFSKIGFTICMWGTMGQVNDGRYLDKDNLDYLVLIE